MSDVEFIFEIDNDPEVYQYLPPGRPFSIEKVNEKLHTMINEQKNNEPFGSWVAECKETKDFIALCVLFKERYDDYELGFVVRKKYWSHGYGSEVANAITNYGFSQSLNKIVAAADVHNKNSWLLLEKIGFIYQETIPGDNETCTLRFYEKINSKVVRDR